MPLIKWLENTQYSKLGLIFTGALLTGLSLLVLKLTHWTGVLIIGMLFMTFGGMIAFPFSNAFAVERAKNGNQGEYMALYFISFSIAHIFGHNAGLQMANAVGFNITWFIISGIALICALILFSLNRKLITLKY